MGYWSAVIMPVMVVVVVVVVIVVVMMILNGSSGDVDHIGLRFKNTKG